ncbi:patatin-like phospholipase family protein [Ornithinimicrobium avium]|uniref:PNPLA domain-containing protein n=1 Tax=Ornithinimicrobium avium TaxID=2283195 RepID=A0A345NKS1_9MICO|nr:patatin-like phospholipase family protein [Ornithinimicrobium avium]AXH95629.1 hypothetical protein DV701_05405 [Ornithinimicrobium avium]
MDSATAGPHARPTLECDIVMKGGITSGVVYPRAVAELARTYRLRCVGGASAGAIAAAAAAAAELGRDSGGFEQLDRMPQALAATGPDGRSTLATFFQPTAAGAPLFRLLGATDGRSGTGLYAALVATLLRGYPVRALVGALPGVVLVVLSLLGRGPALWAGLVGGLVTLVLGVALALLLGVKGTLARVAGDGFGLCTGMPGVDSGDAAALTPWLHEQIQAMAGRGPDAPPLTFGDLDAAGITLRMMTTNLAAGQPTAMPWESREFFFSPARFRRLFPDDVVDWMMVHPPAPEGGPAAVFGTRLLRAQADRAGLRPWPAAADLPVVVATRMSLSFPALICAVPLAAVDYGQPANRDAKDAGATWHREHPEGTVEEALDAVAAPAFTDVWFTDGGLCANLPVHFFDTPLPKRPTFAFNLGPFPPGREKDPDQSRNSYLPTRNGAGLQTDWYAMPTQGAGAWAAFGMRLVSTAREWVDAAQLVLPGYRDRIVTVQHDASEGGMNLSMPEQVVTELAERGRLGAVKLVDAFAGDRPGQVPAWGWDNHRWVRFRTATAGLSGWLAPFLANYRDTTSGGTPYDQLAGPGAEATLPSYPPSEGDRELINARTGTLVSLAEDWTGDDALTARAPRPRPRLRLVPDDGTAAGRQTEKA